MFAGSFVKLAGNKAGTIPLAIGFASARSQVVVTYVGVDGVVVNDYNNGAEEREETSLKVTSP